MIQIALQIERDRGRLIDGERAALLAGIDGTQTIAASARILGISYSTAWKNVRAMNTAFRSAAVVTVIGGGRRGGASLTPLGKELLAHFQATLDEANAAVRSHLAAIERLMVPR